MRDFYLCYPAILTNTLVPQLGLSSILQNQLGVALDALTPRPPVSASEAESAEDIPAASADEEEVSQDPTPLSHQEAVLEENMIVTDPPARQVEFDRPLLDRPSSSSY